MGWFYGFKWHLGYFSSSLFETLFSNGIHLVTGIRNNITNRLMNFYDSIMLCKRSIIETINDELKNICKIEHTCIASCKTSINNG